MKKLQCSAVEGFIWFFLGGIITLLAVLAWLYRGKAEQHIKTWTADVKQKFEGTHPAHLRPDVVAPPHQVPPVAAKKPLPTTAVTAKPTAVTAK